MVFKRGITSKSEGLDFQKKIEIREGGIPLLALPTFFDTLFRLSKELPALDNVMEP